VASEQTRGSVVITGAAGGIGQALVKCFAEAGYSVIGTDRTDVPADFSGEHYIRADLQQSVADPEYASGIFGQIRTCLVGQPLQALINNAAAQILDPVDTLTRENWRTTLDVNLLAPFFWTQAFLPELEACHGTVLNISSIHARLTKPNFTAYATSKAALSGLTRAMAAELGACIRVLAIEPAAINTAMLQAGFSKNPAGYNKLKAYHPSADIGSPSELAELAASIIAMENPFLNGSIINMDGGIGACLSDPETESRSFS
jgi:NAD(P)-dependent dehydrogenase (short-subunit alcohol dehydrogenase family)